MQPKNLEIIAHRGFSARAPENTLIAVEYAIAAEADAIEWDVHVAACGTPVLFHDEELSRTTDGEGLVRDRPLPELRTLDAGRWFGERFEGERIPTLQEALTLARDRVTRVYTEIKGYRDHADLERMLQVVDEADVAGHVFISLNWSALEHVARRDRTATVGYVVETPRRLLEALERSSGNPHALLDIDCRVILEAAPAVRHALARALDRGTEIAVWTVNSPEDADRLRDAGVTRFTTNEVERLVAWRNTVA